MIMKIFFLFVFMTMVVPVMTGQNLIGCKDFEIKKFMKANNNELYLNKVVNSKYYYLKYSDSSESQTLLFFMDTDSVCKSIRMICDAYVKDEKIKEFNSIYKKSGKNKWTDSHDGKDYCIEIKDEDWSSIITIAPLK
jgi:hypothetical protein